MKKLLIFALAAALAVSLLAAPAAAYSDVNPDFWYAEAIDFCTAQGLMDGMGGETFAPEGAVTRAQLIMTLWRLAGQPAVRTPHGFTDVPEGAWYDAALCWARREGVTDGMGDGTFGPDAPLTREQLVVFFHRFAGEPAAEAVDFVDQAAIADWARTAASWALGAGLMQGRGGGVFDPQGGAKRAELAQVLRNYAEKAAAPGGVLLRTYTLGPDFTPYAAAYEDDGALLVTDSFYKVVWRFLDDTAEPAAGALTPDDASGEPYGGYLDGPVEDALFGAVRYIAPFLEGFAVSDPDNDIVRLITDGYVQTLNGIDFDLPTGLAAGDDGALYVANTGAGEVICVTPEGESSVVVSGLDGPTALAFADGVLYVCETDAGCVWRVDADGGKRLVSDVFAGPMGLAVGGDGTVYVADTLGAAVYAVTPAGAVTALLQRTEGEDLELWPAAPAGLVLRDRLLTVCDRFAGVLIEIEV